MNVAPVLLDATLIVQALPPTVGAQLQSLVVEQETTSTQALALAEPPTGRGCRVFLAERQTAGQGRQGRRWVSPPSSGLAMSIARRFDIALARMGGLSLVVGIAIAEALHAHGFVQLRVKWPNDLVAMGRKLGGILIQLRADGPACTQAVIGIGINVQLPEDAAAEIDQAWCDLSQLGGGDVPRNAVTAAVLSHLLPALDQFELEGLAPFLGRWQSLDALYGQSVRVIDGERELHGTSMGIAESGALRVRSENREHVFHGGEVSLRPA